MQRCTAPRTTCLVAGCSWPSSGALLGWALWLAVLGLEPGSHCSRLVGMVGRLLGKALHWEEKAVGGGGGGRGGAALASACARLFASRRTRHGCTAILLKACRTSSRFASFSDELDEDDEETSRWRSFCLQHVASNLQAEERNSNKPVLLLFSFLDPLSFFFLRFLPPPAAGIIGTRATSWIDDKGPAFVQSSIELLPWVLLRIDWCEQGKRIGISS